MFTDVLKERATFNFRVEEKAKKVTSKKQVANKALFLLGLFLDPAKCR
jgi:hypothetical protein